MSRAADYGGAEPSKDPDVVLSTYGEHVNTLADPTAKNEAKIKAVQELSGSLELQTIVSNPNYPIFLKHALETCMKILKESEPEFISQCSPNQQLRKHILEIIHHIPANKHLEPHVESILNLVYKLLEIENEENVLLCLRIIIELHKIFRPKFTEFSEMIQQYLEFVRSVYKDLPNHVDSIFDASQQYQLQDFNLADLEQLLNKTYTVTPVQILGSSTQHNLLPRARLSLKVLAELPIIVLLIYKTYEKDVYKDIGDFIPLILDTITLQPSKQHRESPNFNWEIFVDFMATQVNALTFLANIIQDYQADVACHADKLTKGIFGLFRLCPPEVSHFRKDLLMAMWSILSTDLREKFVGSMDLLLDENILIGTGWTAHEYLRPLAFSVLADLIHQVRRSLSLSDISKAISLFSKNIHDESLLTKQTKYCELLLHLVDSVHTRSELENGNGREILLHMLEVFVLKFKSIAELHLPILSGKCGNHQQSNALPSKNSQEILGLTNSEDLKDELKFLPMPPVNALDTKEEKLTFGFPCNQVQYSINDCRSLVKTLISGVKKITLRIITSKASGDSTNQKRLLQPKETGVYIRLIKYAFQALDVYTLNVTRCRACSKEKKKVLEDLASVYIMMNPMTFREVFATTIEYTVYRILKNPALWVIVSTFLTNKVTSPIFGTILLEYLLRKMGDMGAESEYSSLYLQLFKLIFEAYSWFPDENSSVVKPRLRVIVNQCIALAQSANEPMNYLKLLHALFETITVNKSLIDQVYPEFLPVLPNLLQGLNNLMHSAHKHHSKDMIIELCLRVPVRSSSLLPYLSLLTAPLVAALNGPDDLAILGIQALDELSDILEPHFMSHCIVPVEAELMQALWRTLHNPKVDSARIVEAFYILGKIGGINRRSIAEPQMLKYKKKTSPGPCIAVKFMDCGTKISLPIDKVIEMAYEALKSSNTSSHYKTQSWEVIKGFLAANIEHQELTGAPGLKVQNNMAHIFNTIKWNDNILSPINRNPHRCADDESRKIHELALTAMLIAANIKELIPESRKFMIGIVQHYGMLMVEQQYGMFLCGPVQNKCSGMDPLVLIDAIATVMGHEQQEFRSIGNFALVNMIDTAGICLSSKSKASKLFAFEYLIERVCQLCYERPSYSKFGGCSALYEITLWLPTKCILTYMYRFLKAYLFVMTDLNGEISSGAVDFAKTKMEELLSKYCVPIVRTFENSDMVDLQREARSEVIQEFIQRLTSPNTRGREQAMHCLDLLARISNRSVAELIEPFHTLLEDIVPPWKHDLFHLPINCQIGMLEGCTFCISLVPRLFDRDMTNAHHARLINELLVICNLDDDKLRGIPCYQKEEDFVPLRKSAMKFLAACYFIESERVNIFKSLFKTRHSSSTELQMTGFEGMKHMINKIGKKNLSREILSLLYHFSSELIKCEYLSTQVVQQLNFLTQLYPSFFDENVCAKFLTQLKKYLDKAVEIITGQHSEEASDIEMDFSVEGIIHICASLIDIFHKIPRASSSLIAPLLQLVLNTEHRLLIEASSFFREPLVKFLSLHPQETVELFMSEERMLDEQSTRFFEFLLKNDQGLPFRKFLQQRPNCLIILASELIKEEYQCMPTVQDIRFHLIRTVSLLVRYNDHWIGEQHHLVSCLQTMWISAAYHQKGTRIDYAHWKEPKLLAKCLLNYAKHHTDDIELLFQLIRAFTGRFISDFNFLRTFLEQTVAATYSIEWKRMAFFKFVKIFDQTTYQPDLKAKILQYILMPSFAHTFERGEGDFLIKGTTLQDENIISVFINQLILSINVNNVCFLSDAIRIALLQFSCLLLEHASQHAAYKTQPDKEMLKRWMEFAWPCLLGKSCVDPSTKYYSHLLLANIIAKFAIYRKIVLQVFRSLLKAHTLEARSVVRQALDVLTPVVPIRVEAAMLTHWTVKVIVEEGHSLTQLVHVLQLIVRHYKVYYKVRHGLIHHMASAIHRLVFATNVKAEHKKLAIDLAEVIIWWEVYSKKEEEKIAMETEESENSPAKSQDPKKPKGDAVTAFKKISSVHSDAIANFLLRMACQVNEMTPKGNSSLTHSCNVSNEAHSRSIPIEPLPRSVPNETHLCTVATEALSLNIKQRCIGLLKNVLKSDIWPDANLDLSSFEKLLVTQGDEPASFANICTVLDLLSFLLEYLKKDALLATFEYLHKGLTLCITHNSKLMLTIHNKLSQLMAEFRPFESTDTSNEVVQGLYEVFDTVIHNSLESCQNASSQLPSSLIATLMLLKAVCLNKEDYIDRHLLLFMTCVQKLAHEHLNTDNKRTNQEYNQMTTDILILSIDLVKGRIGIMNKTTRETFLLVTLVDLISKTSNAKVMKAIAKVVGEWVCAIPKDSKHGLLTEIEKSCLLVQLMQAVKNRFASDAELNLQFLESINFLFQHQDLEHSENGIALKTKLMPSFLSGLYCSQPETRSKFFQVFCKLVQSCGELGYRDSDGLTEDIYRRLKYIICWQNWQPMGSHFWIKQCIELMLTLADVETRATCDNPDILVPALMTVLNFMSPEEYTVFENLSLVKEEPIDMEESPDYKGMYGGYEYDGEKEKFTSCDNDDKPYQCTVTARELLSDQFNFLGSLQEIKTNHFLGAVCQLCHMDTVLAKQLWLHLFPRLWKILTTDQQEELELEIVPFLFSHSHIMQKEYHPSSIGTFAEAIALCEPKIALKPPLLQFLGKTYNMWHQSCMSLENLLLGDNILMQFQNLSISKSDNGNPYPPTLVLDMVADMYSRLNEEDLWCGVWLKRAKFSETGVALALEQHGFYSEAQRVYTTALVGQEISASDTSPSPLAEYHICRKHWIRCLKEMNHWDVVVDFANGNGANPSDPFELLENVWKYPDWEQMRTNIDVVEKCCPREIFWKVNLYKGYLSISDLKNHQQLRNIERLVEIASGLCIQEWKKMPYIVSHIHIPILKASQQMIELQDASMIQQGLLLNSRGQQPDFEEMTTILEAWKSRLPLPSDPLSYWSDVLAWRQLQYKAVMSIDTNNGQLQEQKSMVQSGAHAMAHSILHFAKIAHKQGQLTVCLKALEKFNDIPCITVKDIFEKFRLEMKCHLQSAHLLRDIDHEKSVTSLQQGFELLNSLKVNGFTSRMTAEVHLMRALLLWMNKEHDQCNMEFSAAMMQEPKFGKAAALWSEFQSQVFLKDSAEMQQIQTGVYAVMSFLNSCRYLEERKSRDCLAKVFWLLAHDDQDMNMFKAFEKNCVSVQPAHWLPWVPQLLTFLTQPSTAPYFQKLIDHIGRVYPQAVYFQLRSLALLSKAEQSDFGIPSSGFPVWYDKAIYNMMNHHPTVLTCLKEIANQMESFSENYYEVLHRLMGQALTLCYNTAFRENRSLAQVETPPVVGTFLMNIVNEYGMHYERDPETAKRLFIPSKNDYVFHNIMAQFLKDFNVSSYGKLNVLIVKIKGWIQVLENKIRMLPKSFMMDERCKFLCSFSSHIAKIKVPGEFLQPTHNHSYVHISRFIPRIDFVQKHNTVARRIYIQGDNGKVYTYLVTNRTSYGDSRHEERIYQLMRLLNTRLQKHKESAKRFLRFTVPRTVPLSPKMQMVEDNVNSLSLLDIYQQHCDKVGQDHNEPILQYFQKLDHCLGSAIRLPTHSELVSTFKAIQQTLVPNHLLKAWAQATYPSATDYWTFRKQFTVQMALMNVAQYLLHLTALNADMLYIHQDSGLAFMSNVRFNIDSSTGSLESCNVVPCRLTPNLYEFINYFGVSGPMVASVIAAARCFIQPKCNIETLLRVILRDEMIAWYEKRKRELQSSDLQQELDGLRLVQLVEQAVQKIIVQLKSVAVFNGSDSKAMHITQVASIHGNLCRMNPTYHPWL